MQRFVLIHEGQRILLPEGDSLIGRALSCGIRFNDQAVSREHLRVTVRNGRATAVNVSSNGTLLNGARLTDARALKDGDELQLGYRRIRVAVVEETPKAEVGNAQHRAGARAATVPIEAIETEESTGPVASGTVPPVPAPVAITPSQLADIAIHNCPGCRAQVDYGELTCHACGYNWPPGHPSRETLRIPLDLLKPRAEARYRIELPVVYSSSTLTIDAIVRDISRGGMFISTEVLDPVGTPCDLTALPDGHPAMTFSGVVAHVTDDLSVGRSSGLGIRIVGGSPEALNWLEETVARFSDAMADEG